MELITPGIGLLFWQTVTFLVVLLLLGKFAWRPIASALKEREEHIEGSLQAAQQAKEEMEKLHASNEALLQEARRERDKMLKEARETSERIVAEAHDKAQAEGNAMIAKAKATIETEKRAAVTELKNQVAQLSLEIAEKLVRQQLDNPTAQKTLVQKYIQDSELN
ncbi:F-type H+-transporting ATPase subunit b [Catalinimonas alkaloidigena]|uniref:ATP synthase subunit b n=1 Tax=Catalinimonas alkaloidigena TaxID=1075417 RepID=A0A1G9E7Z3_9BACT|nr:F0F1 ATP synthase subunit B [Catalinimonas alkaloidigena]SDK72251.1 F-type H+-transporting ATPase subunit b [Catalinimonas alkaloidigena]